MLSLLNAIKLMHCESASIHLTQSPSLVWHRLHDKVKAASLLRRVDAALQLEHWTIVTDEHMHHANTQLCLTCRLD